MNERLSEYKSFVEVKSVCEEWPTHFSKWSLELDNKALNRTDVDKITLQLLPPNRPAGYLPALTIGDGNCMQHSLSRLVFRNEKHHTEMLCRIIAELSKNPSQYLNEDYLRLGCTFVKGKFLAWIAALSDCYNGEDTSDTSAVQSIFEKETFQARKLWQYLGIWQFMAAANALNCCIISLYPQKGPKEFQALFGRAMLPYDIEDGQKILYDMWSSSRPMRDEHWVANHIVSLVKMHS
ncbi:vertnin [Plakobranchus ocellatus]|uniref:Vertnin n=1 Tax=Plakobranchus ocellatus TaxID=259542 RepID=A0AAV3Y3C4_9GAST|nr:vertnin [Plakobranchus ocellatus]